jgi:hypothetical protein
MPPCVGTKTFQKFGRVEMNKFTCGLVKVQPTITTFSKVDCWEFQILTLKKM